MKEARKYEELKKDVLSGKITGEDASKQLLDEYFGCDNNSRKREKSKSKFKFSKGILSIFTGATILLSTNVALAKDSFAYPKAVNLKTLTKIEEQVKSDSDDATKIIGEDYFAEPDYSGYFDMSLCESNDGRYLRKYINNLGEERYFPCENTHVDDYVRTDDTKAVDDEEFKTLMFNNTWDDITSPHASLFVNKYTFTHIPIYSDENIIDDTWYRLWGIRFLDEEKCNILYKTGLERVIDNFLYIQKTIEEMKDPKNAMSYKYQYILLLSPTVISEKGLICQHIIIDKNDFDIENIKNMLMYPKFLFMTEKEKKYIESKAMYVTFPIEEIYQQKIIVPKVK